MNYKQPYMQGDIINHCYKLCQFLAEADTSSLNGKKQDLFGVKWKNADNIMFGELGSMFFLVELYKKTSDQNVWYAIMQRLEWLEKECAVKSANNYTFLYGKMGFVFLYTKLGVISGDDVYITRAVNICRQHQQNGSLHFMLLNNNSFYDGLAGVLMCLMELYRLCYDKNVLSIIEIYTSKLIQNVRVAEKGIYWGGVTNTSKRRLGLAYGTSGIAFVLLELAQLFDNPVFIKVAYKALEFEDQFWNIESGGWDGCCEVDQHYSDGSRHDNNALLSGSIGMGLTRLYADQVSNRNRYAKEWNTIAKAITERTFLSSCDGIISGKAGYGLAMIEAYGISGNKLYAEKALDIAEKLLQKAACTENSAFSGDLSFGDGKLGIGYFLLKTIHLDKFEPSIFLPRGLEQKEEKNLAIQLDSILLSNENDLGDIILDANFKSSYQLLKNNFNQPVRGFTNPGQQFSATSFISSVQELIAAAALDKLKLKEIANSFEKDCFVLFIQFDLNKRLYKAGSFDLLNDIVAIMKLDEEDFLCCSFVVSPAIWLFERDPIIDFNKILSYRDAVDLFSVYGENSFICTLTPFDSLMVDKLGLDKLFFDQYRNVCSVFQVCTSITNFFMKQGAMVIEMVLFYFNIKSIEELGDKLKEMVVRASAYYFMEGVLEFVPGIKQR